MPTLFLFLPSRVSRLKLCLRDYSENKIKQNIECEIFQTLVEEARDSYKEEIIKVCNSSTIEDMESNERAVVQWVAEFSG